MIVGDNYCPGCGRPQRLLFNVMESVLVLLLILSTIANLLFWESRQIRLGVHGPLVDTIRRLFHPNKKSGARPL
jgi:hypothetical protein